MINTVKYDWLQVIYGSRRIGAALCVCRDILEWNGCVHVEDLLHCPGPNHVFLCVCVSFPADDRWHCFVGRVFQWRRGPGGVWLRTCRWDGCVKLCLLWTWSISPYLSLICYQGASSLSIMSHGSFKCNFEKKPSENNHCDKYTLVGVNV